MATRQPKAPLVIDTLKHEGATRKNIATAECQMHDDAARKIQEAFDTMIQQTLSKD